MYLPLVSFLANTVTPYSFIGVVQTFAYLLLFVDGNISTFSHKLRQSFMALLAVEFAMKDLTINLTINYKILNSIISKRNKIDTN